MLSIISKENPSGLKTNKEIVTEMVAIIIDKIGASGGGNGIMLLPVINMAKLKIGNLTDDDCAGVVDTVHRISKMIETETGVLSPYHGIDD